MTTVPERPRRRWDEVLTVVLMVALIGWCYLLYLSAAISGMTSEGCDSGCDLGLLGTGVALGAYGQAVIVVLGALAATLALMQRRLAFWIPLVAAALGFCILLVGETMVRVAVGSVP